MYNLIESRVFALNNTEIIEDYHEKGSFAAHDDSEWREVRAVLFEAHTAALLDVGDVVNFLFFFHFADLPRIVICHETLLFTL